MQTEDTLVITARPDPSALQRFDEMRRALFPSGRNKVPAHISLFHNLPGQLFETLMHDIASALPGCSPLAETSGVRFLGKGIAYMIAAPGLKQLHGVLSDRYADHLIAQDRQTYSPHVTVMNKADPVQARAESDRLTAAFAPMRMVLTAVDLWLYLPDGTWQSKGDVAWGGTSDR